MNLTNLEKAEKRVALANRRGAVRNQYRSPSLEEIATRAHARTLRYAGATQSQGWAVKDVLHFLHGAALVGALFAAFWFHIL